MIVEALATGCVGTTAMLTIHNMCAGMIGIYCHLITFVCACVINIAFKINLVLKNNGKLGFLGCAL